MSHAGIGTIGADENIAFVFLVVRGLDNNPLVVLGHGEDTLAQKDLVLRDLAQEHVVQDRTGNDTVVVAATVENRFTRRRGVM